MGLHVPGKCRIRPIVFETRSHRLGETNRGQPRCSPMHALLRSTLYDTPKRVQSDVRQSPLAFSPFYGLAAPQGCVVATLAFVEGVRARAK